MNKWRPGIGHRSNAGYTLIEIMVSLTIGAGLIGAVLMAVSGTGLTGRRQDSQAQLAEEGQVALNILTSQLRMAGFWVPTSPMPALEPAQTMLRGCRNGFSNVTAASFDALACNGGTGNDAIAIRYDANEPGLISPADCLGADLEADKAGMVDNRFYISTSPSGNPALYCRGNGGSAGTTPQMLIDNVESLQLRYGIAAVNTPPLGPVIFDPPAYTQETVRYVRASDLTTACTPIAPAANSWCAVTSVRVCAIMRTNDNAAEQSATPYIDCDGNNATVNDRRIRRALTTTVSLRNRTAVANP